MSPQLIGVLIAGLAFLALMHSSRAAFFVLAIACLFQAAAAIIVTALGGASITPGHLALGFFILAVAMRQKGIASALSTVRPARAGFWLAMATLWAIVSAQIMPRLFQGDFEVYPLSIANSLGVIGLVPVGPVSSNLTQSVYFLGNLLCFMAVAGLGRTPGLLRMLAIGLLAAIGFNLFMVVVDQITYSAGLSHLLDFIRNANYGQLFHATVLGMKRITSTFPEASSYATAGMGLFGFALRLWRGGVMTRFSGPLAAAMFVTLLLSTSTTAYLALAAFLTVVYSDTLARLDPALPRNPDAKARTGLLWSLIPLAILFGAMLLALRPDLTQMIADFFDQSVGSKLGSQSGGERMRWNLAGLDVISQTLGLGAGLGSVRTSSFLIGLPANVGLIGAILFAFFLVAVLKPPSRRKLGVAGMEADQIAAAGRSGAFGILLAACASGGTADLGILFFIFAGVASASVFQTVNFDRVGSAAAIPEAYLPNVTRRPPRSAAT